MPVALSYLLKAAIGLFTHIANADVARIGSAPDAVGDASGLLSPVELMSKGDQREPAFYGFAPVGDQHFQNTIQ